MVEHEAIGEEPDGVSGDGQVEDAGEGVVVIGVVEDGEPCVGAVEGVIDQPAFGGSWWSSHIS